MAQDPHEVAQLCKALEAAKGSGKAKQGKKGFSCKKSTFTVAHTNGITVDSWRFQDWDYKRDDLPTYARGLFTTMTTKNTPEICIRGYDKFFNVGEVKTTEWGNVENNTQGPYELSVKENGCIIFMSGLEDGTLLVCSKHSTGAREDVEQSHALVGEKWAKRHLEKVGKTTQDLAMELRRRNLTAVAELCDDDFEEHVLEYPPEVSGLYIHGLNYNLPEFATLSAPEVHEFADTWGFKKAQYVMIQHLSQVKSFLDQCAETGSWDGRDTEGFVVRCKLRTRRNEIPADWFFKYKFEEPYLMYRQWRECTKAIIAGKPPLFKKHRKITEEYLFYARQQLANNPKLGKEYNMNHGIIAMRDGFLAYKGIKGSDIIASERQENGEDQDGAVTKDIVLVPIATIGCGKTTIAKALVKLFDFGHFQNDNVEGKGNRPARFVQGLTQEMAAHKITIADRNNHQKRERQQLIQDVSRIARDARFVALHYVHEPKHQLLPSIRKVTQQRVLDRGDNHQTIHASKGEREIVGIMEGFLGRFEACDTKREPDSSFDEVINLDVTASSLQNLEVVISRLYEAYPKAMPENMPTQQDMEQAIQYAMGATVDLKHDLSFGGGRGPKQKPTSARNGDHHSSEPLTTEQAIAKLEYFQITVSSTVITSTLSALFQNSSPDEAKMYKALKQSRRIQQEFHVTLIHTQSRHTNTKTWNDYASAYHMAMMNPSGKESDRLSPNLGPARLRLERLVWDDRVMALVIRILPTNNGTTWPCANEIPHITIGTAKADIKPVESNELLARWMAGGNEGGKIMEKEVPGMKVLDGTVRAVLRRGR